MAHWGREPVKGDCDKAHPREAQEPPKMQLIGRSGKPRGRVRSASHQPGTDQSKKKRQIRQTDRRTGQREGRPAS